jgi:hypothetical protein
MRFLIQTKQGQLMKKETLSQTLISIGEPELKK